MCRRRFTCFTRFLLASIVAWMFGGPVFAALAAPGLIGRATDGTRSIAFVAPTPNATLGPADSIHPQLRPAFQVEWTGTLNILRAANYTLRAPGKVFVDGNEIQGRATPLAVGERLLRIEFQRPAGPTRFQLEWESDFFPREPVPARLLAHSPSPDTAAATTLERGRQLVEDLNCTACHETGGKWLAGRRGPDLSRIGERATAAWLAGWLENPRHFRADAAMPVMLKEPQDRADVAAYLSSLKSDRPPAAMQPGNSTTGAALAGSIGCAACHDDARNSLAGLGSKFPEAAALARYLIDPLAVDPSGRMPDLALNQTEAADLAAHLLASRKPEFEKPAPAGNAPRGRTLVATIGCANCHTVTDTQGTVRPHAAGAPLAAANPERGCLADTPPTRAANYALKAADRDALRVFLKSPDVSTAPAQDFRRAVATFQCNACHELNSPALLRPEPAPPSLTDSGNKLRASWLEEVLLRHKRVRPWMALRMPHYGPAGTPLVSGFAAQAGAEPGEGAKPPATTPPQIEAGAQLIGSAEGGLSCINCHDFKGEPSPGQMRGPDLTEMNARIRTDWLRRWLRDPPRIQEGTAMPAFFTDMPAARADEMIERIVHVLGAGPQMPTPPGWGAAQASYVVTVTDEPVLIRTFLPECSPRGIAVGLPGGQSYCFDAGYGLLRYAWRGGFLDAKGAWSERGGQVSTPLGEPWFKTTVHPLRLTADPAGEQRVRFRGYQLDQGVPVFRYEINGTPVTERITATKDQRGLVREFTLTAPPGEVTVLEPNTPGITATVSVGAFVNGRVRVPAAPLVRFSLTFTPK